MAKFHSSFLLLLLLLFLLNTTSTSADTTPAPTPFPTTTSTPTPTTLSTPTPNATTITLPPTPPPPPSTLKPSQQDLPLHHQEQLNNIIDALIGAGDFQSWANVLSISADLPAFPLSATFFIPADDSFPPITTTMDPFIVPYHIVPQRLSFADLRQFKPFSRLPTLLPSKSILITNNSFSNFTLDASRLSHPDFYTSSAFAVHGITNLLNYSVYGDPEAVKPSKPKMLHYAPPPPPNFMAGDDEDEEELIGSNRYPYQPEPESESEAKADSDAACLCNNGVSTIFLVVCAVLASKIQGMNLGLMAFLD